ncbi:alpha/beta fold hydrolase [Albirhodobacter sp. R86504]|uniref:alpha/beta fold hydrolase n=1 Tax=Albirhodobacter sp. R86504 TaxID=3093848 RepID=UPI003671564E
MISWKLASSIALVVLIGAGCTRAAWRETAAEAAYPPTGQFVDVAGKKVHMEIAGSGPDLVLIHGASGSLRDMTFRLTPLLTDHYRVFTVDRPGFGYSDAMEDVSLRAQAAQIRAAVEKAGARTPIVFGHSYGGAVALAWAAQAPASLRAMVLASAPSHLWEGPPPLLYQVTGPWLGQKLITPLITAWAPDSVVEDAIAQAFAPQPVPEGYAAHFGPEMTLRRETMRVNARQRLDIKSEIATLLPTYADLTLPIELVHGDADETVYLDIHSRALANEVASARLAVLEGQGHMIQHTAADDLKAAIDRAAKRSAN